MFAFIAWLFGRGSHALDHGLNFEAELIERQAERKAVLLRRATRYADEGLAHVAEELRQRAEALSFERSLASLAAPPAKPTPADGPASTRSPAPTTRNGEPNRPQDFASKKR
ncbi:hypothetical protein AYO40_04455 [Planctomycetaceae bacterium SCGC AG-212-D15]|nr:hypothetical protein AYO40_04455 [Planctomycetaceae bacterium SCGC AG-212-D15]